MCASVRESPASGKSSTGILHGRKRVNPDLAGAEIWLIDLARYAGDPEGCETLLSAEETARAAQFKSLPARTRYVTTRAQLRALLGSKLAQAPESLEIATGLHGKPVLARHPELRFNVSHTDDLAIVAISETHEVGVDIESLARTVDHDALARKYFSATERHYFSQLPAIQRNAHFLRTWTCKEAIAKARGDGLHAPFAQIEVSVGTDTGPRLLALPGESTGGWTLHDMNAGRGYVATLALRIGRI